MARYTKTFVVNAPQGRVYEGWLNAMETLVKLAPERFRSFRVITPGTKERLTECVERWAGRELKYQTKEILNAPQRAEQLVVSGHAKGSRTMWTFQPFDGGTRVAVDLHLAGFEGFMVGVLMRKRFRAEMDETLALWSQAIAKTPVARLVATQ